MGADAPDIAEDAGEAKVVNMQGAARACGVSVNAFRAWLDDPDSGLPILEVGGNGRAYRFDLDAVVEWRRAKIEDARVAAERRDDEIRQARLDLVGGDGEDELAGLSPAEREREIRIALQWQNLARSRRELIRADLVDRGVGRLIGAVVKSFGNLTDEATRELGLTGESQERLQAIVDRKLNELADAVGDMEFDGDEHGRRVA